MASRGVNKVILVGNLGNDPEVRALNNGGSVTTISIATSESWKDKQTGENQERTEWHRVKFFGRLAEISGEYLKKGKQVYIEGSLRTEKYTDKDGVERYTTDIIANEMQMLGGVGESGGGGGQRSQQGSGQQSSGNRSQQGGGGQRGTGGGSDGNERQSPPAQQRHHQEFSEEEIPFLRNYNSLI